jgi:RecA-family ATPase/5S rRNA maturation endonuclease (ribonuclease M5)
MSSIPHDSTPGQAHTRQHPCEHCQGYDDRRLGDRRCWGKTYGDWCYCTNGHVDHGDAKRNEKAQAWVHFLGERTSKSTGGSRQRSFPYCAADGTLRYTVHRIGDGENKKIWQEAPSGARSLKGIELVPYRLPELLAVPNAVVYIAEGEPKVDALRQWGLTATCNVGGAGMGWRSEYTPYLKGRQVVILPDNDEKGQKHAQKTAEMLSGVAASIKIVELPNLPPKGDIINYIAAGGTVEQLRQFVDQAKKWREQTPEETLAYWASQGFTIHSKIELLRKAIPPIRWVIPEYLAEGLTLLGAKAKTGKSWFSLALCEACSCGGLALEKHRVVRGPALYLALEENERRMQDRLKKIQAQSEGDFEYSLKWPPLDNGGLALLRAWLQARPGARLVVIDTLTAVRKRSSGKGRLHDEDYDSMHGLQQMAAEYHVAILIIHHCKKGAEDDAFDEMSGSQGLNAVADNLIVIRREPESTDAIIYFRGRDVDSEPRALEWDKLTCQWKDTGPAMLEQLQKSAQRKDIILALRAAKRPMTPKEIADVLGKKDSTNIRALLVKMKHAKAVIEENGAYSLPTKEYDHTDHSDNVDHTDHTDHTPDDDSPTADDEGVIDDEEPITDPITATPPDTDGPEAKNVTTVIDVIDVTDADEDDRPTGARLKAIQKWQVDPAVLNDAAPAAPDHAHMQPPVDDKAFIEAWAKQHNYPPVGDASLGFYWKNKREWDIGLMLSTPDSRRRLANYLRKGETGDHA